MSCSQPYFGLHWCLSGPQLSQNRVRVVSIICTDREAPLCDPTVDSCEVKRILLPHQWYNTRPSPEPEVKVQNFGSEPGCSRRPNPPRPYHLGNKNTTTEGHGHAQVLDSRAPPRVSTPRVSVTCQTKRTLYCTAVYSGCFSWSVEFHSTIQSRAPGSLNQRRKP